MSGTLKYILRLITAPPFLVFLGTFAPFIFFVYPVSGCDNLALEVDLGIDFTIYAILCVVYFFLFFAGTVLFYSKRKNIRSRSRGTSPSIRSVLRRMIVCVVVLVSLGIASTLCVALTLDGERLARALVAAQPDPDLRWDVITADVPGIIRMFNYCIPAAAVVVFAALLAFPSLQKRVLYWLLVIFVIACVLLRGAFWMDRATVVSTLVIAIYACMRRVRVSMRALGFVVLVVSCVGLVTVRQANVRGLEKRHSTILSYADLGMANALLAFRSSTVYSFGMESLVGPLDMVQRGVGLNLPLPTSNRKSFPDPASNLLGYSYADFGWLGFFTYIIWGGVSGIVISRSSMQPWSLENQAMHLWLLYALLTIWVIPITRGPDFWCGAIMSLLGIKYIVK